MTRIAVLWVVLALPLVWIGGEMHRSNCIRTGRTGCSVLPWQTGKPKTVHHQPTKLPLTGKLPLG